MNLEEKQLSKQYIYKGKIINLRKDTALLPNGSTEIREVVEHPGGVCVAALAKAFKLESDFETSIFCFALLKYS